ncbi:MAG: gyrA, partial [Chitinophagaceae bacterium]|nr:gyrA [Chitinophagaceae bacterium]
ALDHLDEVIKLIRESRDPEDAKAGLITNFNMSEIQAKAVLELRLQRLTGMERDKIVKEFEEIMALITRLKEILASKELRMEIIKGELQEMKERYGDERRTQIVPTSDDISIEDMIADDDMVITVSHEGYIKRTALTEYRTQSRGGVGSKGAGSKDSDFTEHLFVATAHNYLLIFTEQGKVFWLKVYEIPEGGKTTKGRAIQNLLQIEPSDAIRTILNVKNLKDEDYLNNNYLIMCTEQGTIKKTTLEAYSRPRAAGINAINISEGDRLLDVKLTTGNDEIVIALKSGRAIRFNESQVRPMGRVATGVKGVTLSSETDKVVGLVAVNNLEETQLLVISKKGYGKRSSIEDYRITKRGGKGVKTINVTDKTGELVAIHGVTDRDQIMIINKSGITIRMNIESLRIMGRATQGVRLIKLNDGDEIASIAKIERDAQDEDEAAEVVQPDLSEVLEEDPTAESETEEEDEDETTTEE